MTWRNVGYFPVSVALGVVWVVVWLSLVGGRGLEWAGSWDQALEAVNICCIVVWPAALGLAAARSVYLVRSRAADYLSGAPGTPVSRFIARGLATLWMGALAGACVSVVLAGSVSLWLGSSPSIAFLAGLSIGVFGVAVVGVIGALLGLVWSSYLVALVGAIAGYAIPAFALPSSRILFAFTGTTAAAGSALRLRTEGLPAFLAMLGLVLVAASLALVYREAGPHLQLAARIAVPPVICGLVALAALPLTVIDDRNHNDDLWVHAGPAAWTCQELPGGSKACIANDLSALASEYVTAMRRLDTVNRRLFPGHSFGYAQQSTAFGETLEPRVFVQIESSLTDPWQTWARAATSFYLLQAADLTRLPATPPALDCADASALLDDQSLSVLRGNEVDESAFLLLIAQVVACRE